MPDHCAKQTLGLEQKAFKATHKAVANRKPLAWSATVLRLFRNRDGARLLTRDEVRRIAVNIAKLRELLR